MPIAGATWSRIAGLAALGLVLAGAAGAAPRQSSWAFSDIGEVLGPASVGQAPGGTAGTADPTAALLADGRIRLYFAAHDGIRSAVSPDGLKLTVEPGLRLQRGQSGPHSRILRLPDGRWRLYFNVGQGGPPPAPGSAPPPRAAGIGSAISSDGLTFTLEPGLRIDAAAAGVSSTASFSTGDVLKLRNGSYRLYFSVLDGDTGPARQVVVKSAVSSDLLTWTVEPGVRVGPGAPSLTGSAEHPAAFLAPDGSIVLVYGRPIGTGGRPCPCLFLATSQDGLAFGTETLIGGDALDSAVVRRRDGTFLVYYGNHTEEAGSTIRVGKLTPPASAKPPKAPKKPVPKCKKGQKPTKQKPCRK